MATAYDTSAQTNLGGTNTGNSCSITPGASATAIFALVGIGVGGGNVTAAMVTSALLNGSATGVTLVDTSQDGSSTSSRLFVYKCLTINAGSSNTFAIGYASTGAEITIHLVSVTGTSPDVRNFAKTAGSNVSANSPTRTVTVGTVGNVVIGTGTHGDSITSPVTSAMASSWGTGRQLTNAGPFTSGDNMVTGTVASASGTITVGFLSGNTDTWTVVGFEVYESGGSTVSGTIAVTQDSQTSSATGSSVTGTSATTQDAQTSAAAGAHGVAGAAASTEQDDTSSASGSSTTGSSATTQDDQTSSAAGGHGVAGAAASTQDDQTSAAAGSSVVGSSATTQDDQTSSASGTASGPGISGTIAVTQDDQTSTAAGAHGIAGTAANVQDDQTSTAAGSSVTGSSTTTQDDQTSSASGTANPPGTSGSIAVTQDDQTSAGSGAHGVAGTSATTQDDQTSAGSGSSVVGSVAVTQADQTSSATGSTSSPTVTGTISVLQQDQTSDATGSSTTGTIAVTQDSQTSAAVGSSVAGAAANVQADQVSSATGTFGDVIVFLITGPFTLRRADLDRTMADAAGARSTVDGDQARTMGALR